MSLLDKIYDYLADQSASQLNKAKRIINSAKSPLKIKWDADHYVVNVPSESGNGKYEVDVYDEDDDDIWEDDFDERLTIMCECPAFDTYDDCKHCVAAAIALQTKLTTKKEATVIPLNAKPAAQFDVDAEGYYHFVMIGIDDYALMRLAGKPAQSMINKIASNVKHGPLVSPHINFGYYEKGKRISEIDIIFNGVDGFKTHCTCGNKTNPICKHVFGSFVFLLYHHGRYFFSRFKEFKNEKNTILAGYGLNLNDPEAKDFEWMVSQWGELQLKARPGYLVAAGSKDFLQSIKKDILGDSQVKYSIARPKMPENTLIDFEIGFVLNFTSARHIGFELETAFVRDKNSKTDIKKLLMHNESNWPFLQSLSDGLYGQIMEFTDQKLIAWLIQNGSAYLKNYASPYQQLSDLERLKLKKHYFGLLQGLWPVLCQEPFVFRLDEGRFSNASVKPAKLGKTAVKLFFTADADERFITIQIGFKPGEPVNVQNPIVLKSGMLLDIEGILYLPETTDDISLIEKFGSGKLKFPIADRLEIIRNVVLPLQTKYEVNIGSSLNFNFTSPEPQSHLLLSEFEEKFLMLKPRFQYDDMLIEYDEQLEHVEQKDGALNIINRNKSAEKSLYEYLRTLHPKFSTQRNNLYYFLPFGEVMKGNWFLNMIQHVQEAGYPVFGLQDLKTFRYNTNTPTFEIKAGTGIDWFDLEIEISWGDQQASLKDIRKAILNKQEAILLDDGTLGLIPTEWLEQYGMLLKIGMEKDGKVQVSKLHYSLLAGLNLNNEQVEQEIAEKKKKLQNFTAVQNHKPQSPAVTAQLRPYQSGGFQWLQALDDLGWGGCLADDMGLGKTLQAITFLQFLKEKKPGSTQLIVCPTSLIFNWESELDKFCPTLKYHTYYGSLRSFDDDHFEKFDIVLTTYGVIRMDIEHLSTFNWHYIILDESQAIKNPDAQVTKSLQLLKSTNRLMLSGTPVQNNTYDLFAQFNFINPGFLGNREFFKREFAVPIDKYGDKTKSEQLRKMVYPFMLRRTKEQVAADLPDKTETILWCSMGKAQRSMYDEYKNYYRSMLLKKIDEEGMGKSGIYVLEGLLRLRQICDHPFLIKADHEAPNESVKTEELMREIQENSGGHKLLVFSQFTEMLHIIKKELELAGITYCYLDGSTPGEKRKVEVNRFQEDESIKVFLISLKAGGVGLNLTAADYVYLVDPWWNPAAEAQAIDRTHRIGQTRKIFAYKMICKDTVEEKILQLQQKKKSLADDLVNEDSGFVKKLTKDDIAFLFS